MLKAGIRMAPGFALSLHANDLFMEETGIKAELAKYIANLGAGDRGHLPGGERVSPSG